MCCGPFGYWLDYGDDWWHQIDVLKIEDKLLRVALPRFIERVGKSPSHYTEEDE